MNHYLEALIITGSCAVGKTTIAKAWAKSKNGAIIECDCLTEWIYKEDFPHRTSEEEEFTTNLSTLIAFEYLKKGMSVAIENVWSPQAIDILRAELFRMRDLKVKTIRLTCDLEENQRRDSERIPENQMKDRVKTVSEEQENHNWASYVQKIDTTNLSVEEILQKIESGE